MAGAGRVAAFGEARAEGLGVDWFPRCLRLCFALSLCCLLWCWAEEGRSRGWGGLLPALVSLRWAIGCLRSDPWAEA